MKDYIVLRVRTAKVMKNHHKIPSTETIALDFDWQLIPHLSRSVNIIDGLYIFADSKEEAIIEGDKRFDKYYRHGRVQSLSHLFYRNQRRGGMLFETVRNIINEVMIKCDGNQSKAANILNLDRKTISRMLDQYGLRQWIPKYKEIDNGTESVECSGASIIGINTEI